jgi:hypothetical protein
LVQATKADFTSNKEEQAQHSVTHPWRVIVKNNHGEKLVGILHDTGSKEHGDGS